MQLTFDSDVEEFRAEFAAFLDEHVPSEAETLERPKSVSHMPQWARDWQRLLFDNGWLLPAQPPEFGGRNATVLQQFVHLDELCRRRIYHSFNPQGVNIIAASLLSFGSDEQKHRWAVPVLRGEKTASLGMSEPSAGSDLASLRTRAELDGDHFVVNGQKVWTSGAHDADFLLTFVRTDPDAPKHKGITIFFFPMNLPGITVQPVDTLQDERTNITFYDDVRVSDRYRLGEVNGGLKVMAAAMEIEHGGEGYHIYHHSLMKAAIEWASTADPQGRRPIDRPAVRSRLARVRTHLEIADLMCRRVTWAIGADRMTRAIGPMAKMFATEIYMEDAADLTALAAPATLRHETPAAAKIEESYRQSIGQTIYGGTSEVHRGIIAQHHLGLPRA